MKETDLNALLSGGWKDVDKLSEQAKAQNKKAAQERYDKAVVVARCFTAGDGPLALEILHEMTVEQPTFPVDNLGLINAVGYGIYREGQNSLFRWIQRQIAIAQEGPPK